MAIEREKSLVVVVGDGVDSVSLAGSLRKKLGSATIESVQEVKAEVLRKKTQLYVIANIHNTPRMQWFLINTLAIAPSCDEYCNLIHEIN